MFENLKRWWKYGKAKANQTFEQKADPEVQLQQAIDEAQSQHRRLKEQAASVIANQKQAELRLNNKMKELEKLSNSARQAVLMADDAFKRGDAAKGAQYTAAAEQVTGRLLQLEADIEDLKQLAMDATRASDQARAAVEQNSRVLQQRLTERAKLMSQLDQAKMQEEMNRAMASLNEAVGQDVPTFEQVREKIELRYVKAKGMAEIQDSGVDARLAEIEQAAASVEARGRLDEIRAELGLAPAEESPQLNPPTGAPAADTPAPD